jgi:hypothetical protein
MALLRQAGRRILAAAHHAPFRALSRGVATGDGGTCRWAPPDAIRAIQSEIGFADTTRGVDIARTQEPSLYRALLADVVKAPSASRLRHLAPPTAGLLATSAHDVVLAELAVKCTRLSNDGFYTKGDVASRTLLGPRGIGKSTTLRAFAAVAPLVFPNVIPLYISFISRAARSQPLMTTVAAALRDNGIRVDDESVDGVADALYAASKYALLLVDEIDKLYEAPLPPVPWMARIFGAGPWLPPAVQTLHDLAHIGDHTSGRFSTILCGSSGMLVDLLTMNAATNTDAMHLFPLLRQGLNINGSKFKELRIFYGSSVGIGSVGAVMGMGADERTWSEEARRAIKLYTFAAGTTARALDEVAQRNLAVSANTIDAQYVGNADAARRTLFLPATADVWHAVMTRLWHKNRAVMESLVDHDCEPRLDAIQTGDWPTSFRPLDLDDKKELCTLLRMDPLAFHTRLVHLYDRDWLAFGDSAAAVFPRSLWSLVSFKRTCGAQSPSRGEPSRGASALASAITAVNQTGLPSAVAAGAFRELGRTMVASAVRVF